MYVVLYSLPVGGAPYLTPDKSDEKDHTVDSRIGVAELRSSLASVLDSAENGSVYLVTRTGRDVAVIGPASGSVSELSQAADGMAAALSEARSGRAKAMAEVARLRAYVSELEDALANAREVQSVKRRWGKQT